MSSETENKQQSKVFSGKEQTSTSSPEQESTHKNEKSPQGETQQKSPAFPLERTNVFDAIEKDYDLTNVKPFIKKESSQQKAFFVEAHKLFLTKVPIVEIARRFKLHRHTIINWANSCGWYAQRERLREMATSTNMDKTVQESKTRGLKMAKLIQAKMVQGLQNGDLQASVTDGLKAIELEQRLLNTDNSPVEEDTIKEIEKEREELMKLSPELRRKIIELIAYGK